MSEVESERLEKAWLENAFCTQNEAYLSFILLMIRLQDFIYFLIWNLFEKQRQKVKK